MTASTISSPARRTGRATTSRRLSGFGPLFRKDIGEWRHGKRAWVILIVTTLFLVLTAANGAIQNWGEWGPPPPARGGGGGGWGPPGWVVLR